MMVMEFTKLSQPEIADHGTEGIEPHSNVNKVKKPSTCNTYSAPKYNLEPSDKETHLCLSRKDQNNTNNSLCKDARKNEGTVLFTKASGLTHFMKLGERKDLLYDNTLEDPLGPDSFENFEWVDVKQEVRDDVEVGKVTLTELPIKFDNIEQQADLTKMPEQLPDSSIESENEHWELEALEKESSLNLENNKTTSSKTKRINKPKNCEVCGKCLSSMSNLRLHMLRKHKQKMSFTCDLCDVKFDLRREVVQHRNKVHKQVDGYFHCEVCETRFLDYHTLIVHIKAHINRCKEEVGSNGICKECGKTFKDEESLKTHKILIHENKGTCIFERLKTYNKIKPFICDTCGKRFAFSCILRDHMNLHTGSKPYTCQSCGKAFAQKATLKHHTKTHSDVRPFQCTHCPLSCYSKGDLKKHLRKHTGERPYVCEVCGEGFSRGAHLSVHRRSHTGEKPYPCDLCGRGFAKQGDVVRHRRIHTGELPYLCQVCGKTFRQSTQCANHIKSHHPDTPVPVTRNHHPVT